MNKKLSALVRVGSRFGRSVNLERDFNNQVSLDGYIFTTTARSTLNRLSSSLTSSGPRAVTITGPYGSGKSAFALFAAKVLSSDLSEDTRAARNTIKEQDKTLWYDLFDRRRKTSLQNRGLCPVLVTGSRESLGKALLRALAQSVNLFWPKNPPLFLAEIESLLIRAEAGEVIPGRQIAEVFEQVTQKICTSRNPGNGLFVVIDELGKFLEYAAANPLESDIFILQELAETAKRSGDYPILLVTVLHQTFDRYFERLGRAQKEEWMKVQGRFEDIAFQEPVEQLLKIIANAISYHGDPRDLELLEGTGRRLARKTAAIGLISDSPKHKLIQRTLAGCMPLHPVVALTLGHLFRRIGQNERSLFAFLTSYEPYGFQEFLEQTDWNKQQPATLTLDRIYDYTTTALGSGLYAQTSGKKWAEIETALNRLTDPTELETRLIKTIGLLRIIGDIGVLKPSKEILRFALTDSKTTPEDIDRSLASLEKRSVIIYRRHNDSFSLWEGSDIDIEARVSEARSQLNPNESLAPRLMKYLPPRPIVARRHSLKTGTLRYFEIRYVDFNGFEGALTKPLEDADGLILYAIALNSDEIKQLNEKAADDSLALFPHVLIAIPQDITGLREAVMEVASLRWVQAYTPELEGDRTARNEIQARLAQAEELVGQILQSFFESSEENLRTQGNGCRWYRKGQRISITSARALQEYASRVCDEVFNQSPLLHNELINRRQLSSSAAAARRDLIAAMIVHGDQEALGITGFPPQLSMYFSLLQETGIHRENGGRWGFYPPNTETNQGIVSTWKAIDDFFTETEVARRSIAELFELLARPPYGLKKGPLPVLLCAALMHYDTEVALYEQGTFVPSITPSVFERLIKAPEKFHAQRCRIAGVRAAIFERFANALLRVERAPQEKPNLLSVVRPLTRFAAGLPQYTRHTQRLSPAALRVRDALFEAREPDHLLFVRLPEACGYAPFISDGDREMVEVDDFFKTLRESFSELQRAYDDLLSALEALIITAFELRKTGAEARIELRERALPLADLTVDPKLKSFIIRSTDDSLDLVGWIESISTLLTSKPPGSWSDADIARYQVNLAEVSRTFLHIELLSFELRKNGAEATQPANDIIRLGVTIPYEPELQRVLSVNREDRALIENAERSVEAALTSANLNGDIELRLIVLANLSRKMLDQLENRKQQSMRA